ncbi:hypothetical protein Hypma_012227 [Hypsizygus marmoreus]|uniref:Uncharacterized protein n=1 Tax=Hypsizygus marmoreus TaxID=39966 RepID=A0A369JF36_HYPMA|nr:hypothetical protein Hypma_012227 [Hypsizygus marmoreus]
MFKALVLALFTAVVGVYAERHTVHFDNRCGFGTPTLVQSGRILSTGGDYTINGPLLGAILLANWRVQAEWRRMHPRRDHLNEPHISWKWFKYRYLTYSSVCFHLDFTVIWRYLTFSWRLAFSVTSGFGYYNGCDGAGANCNNPNCPTAFHVPSDTFVQVACQVNDVNLAITFCL